MGMIGRWRDKRRLKKAIGTIQSCCAKDFKRYREALSEFHGKDTAELTREGGWDLVAGNNFGWLRTAWRDSNAIWKSYTVRDMEITYAIASAIHACVRIKCTTVNQAHMQVGRWTAKGWKPYDSHPFYQLMRRPNGGQDRATFLWDVVSHADLTGWSYIWKIRNKGGQVMALQPIPTSWVRRVYNERTGELIHYEIKRTGTDQGFNVPVADMFFVQYPNPSDPTQAAGPLGAALKDLQVDDARANLLIEMLTNIHFPGTIFKSDKMWTIDQKEEARAMLQDLIGPGKRAKPLFVDGKDTDVTLPDTPKDMDWPGTAAQAETRICSTFGVPPILIHLRSGLERSTYSNYNEARRSFYNDSMRSLWILISAAFERGIFLDEGDLTTEIEPDFSKIPEMQEDQEKQHERIRKDLVGGLIMWDEAREAIGQEALPNKAGQVFWLPMGVTIVGLDGKPVNASLVPDHMEGTEVVEEDNDDDDNDDIDEDDIEDADDDAEDAAGKTSLIIMP